MSRRVRRHRLAGLVFLTALAAACGSASSADHVGSVTPTQAVMAALTKMEQTGSFELTWINTYVLSPASGYTYLSGAVDLTGGRLKMTLVSLLGDTAKGLGPGSSPPVHLPGGVFPSTLICIGSDMWVRENGSNLWLRTAPKSVGGLRVSDPGRVFADLKANLTGITAAGRARIDGIETRRFHGEESGTVSGFEERTAVDLWIDADSLIRQLTIDVIINAPVPTTPETSTPRLPIGPPSETVTARFTDFGVKTDIQPPPASEVTDVASPAG